MDYIYTLTERHGKRYISKKVSIKTNDKTDAWKKDAYRFTTHDDCKRLQFVSYSTNDKQKVVPFSKGVELFNRLSNPVKKEGK